MFEDASSEVTDVYLEWMSEVTDGYDAEWPLLERKICKLASDRVQQVLERRSVLPVRPHI